MTAREKANELVYDKFRKGINVSKFHLKHDPSNLKKAKQCALIAVEEIRDFLREPRFEVPHTGEDWKYLMELKEEINNL